MGKRIGAKVRKFPWWLAVASLLLFLWNYKEVVYKCTDVGCPFLLLHLLYHNIEELSLVDAASFFSLFAMVIALIQTIYPYRLGEVYGYPIGRLKKAFDKRREIQELVFCAFTAVAAEVLKLHILEAGVILTGYIIIGKWIYELIKWYETFEDKKSEFIKQFTKDLELVLEEGQEGIKAEKEIYELIERIVRSGGVDEREILEKMASKLYEVRVALNDRQYQKIFELSFYMAELMVEDGISNINYSWNLKMLKESVSESSRQMKERELPAWQKRAEEAFLMGILCGCLSEDNRMVSRWCIHDILFRICNEAGQLYTIEITRLLCVFLELYCDINEKAAYSIDMMANECDFHLDIAEGQARTIKLNMEWFYRMLLRLNYVNAITEYDLIDTLEQELSGMQKAIPRTVFGIMLTLSGKGGI